jgi:hypothetical protein
VLVECRSDAGHCAERAMVLWEMCLIADNIHRALAIE